MNPSPATIVIGIATHTDKQTQQLKIDTLDLTFTKASASPS